MELRRRGPQRKLTKTKRKTIPTPLIEEMEDYNSNSTGSESDQEESGLRSNRASTFVMNEGFEFDLGGGDDGKPLQSWSFKKIRDDFKSQRPANTTSVNEKISKLLSRRETREKNLQKMQQSQQQQQKRKSGTARLMISHFL